VSVAPNTIPSTNPWIGPGIGRQGTIGTGSFTAFTDASESSSGTTFTQTDRAWGSVGDDALAVEGCSFGYSLTYNLFTFDFGSTTTDFTVAVREWAYSFDLTVDAPPDHDPSGERRTSGSAGYQLVLDDASGSINYNNDLHVFEDLTGVHTFRFGTFAETGVAAVYPYKVPETGATLALFGIAMLCLVGLKLAT
ncbi:MAG: hypothetical protein H0U23_00110, partial [Blastocatellia bacterium]|nr:hypothetical protein [Blastocatellia bacterium]